MDEAKKPTDDDSLDTRLDPAALENHPINAEVYRDVPDDEFVESVRQHGILQPIVLAANAITVVSGHRRRQAAIIAKLPDVPVRIRRDLVDDLDIRKAALESNRNRVKTPEQIARELEEWKRIAAMQLDLRDAKIAVGLERKKTPEQIARELKQWKRITDKKADNQSLGGIQTPHQCQVAVDAAAASHHRGGSTAKPGRPPGEVTAEAASAAGLSRRTAYQAVAVGRAIDEAEAVGNTELAVSIRAEKTIDGAYNVAKGKKKSGTRNPGKKKEPLTIDNPAETLKAMAKVIEVERTKIDAVVAKVGTHSLADKALKDLDTGIVALRKWAQQLEKRKET